MEQIKIIYSLNTYPITHNRWNMGNRFEETIYMTAASILYSSLWYDAIELYVDPIGYKYLADLPCEVIKTDFGQEKELWMEPKITVIKNQQEPFVHIDTDVFIKAPIEFKFDQVIVERKDVGYKYYKDLITFFDQYCENMPFWDPGIKYAWSCGVVGFKDMSLRDEYILFYNMLKDTLNNHRDAYESYQEEGFGYLEVGLLLEQYNLVSMLAVKNIQPSILIHGKDIEEQSTYANSIGYTHLLGASKYHSYNTHKIKDILKQKFPKYYKIIRIQLETNLKTQLSKVE